MEEENFAPPMEALQLTEEEQQVLYIDADEIARAERELQNVLVCKVLTSETTNVHAFRYVMRENWSLEYNEVGIVNMGRNIYLCRFNSLNDKQWVLDNGPWSFDKGLVVLEHSLRGHCRIRDLEFRYASFWIHFHDLPFCCFSRRMATAFGNAVGSFEGVETNDQGMCKVSWGCTLRVRVRIDVRMPLRRVVKLRMLSTGQVTLIPMTYEKLPDFCYGCGKLGHALRECDTHSGTAVGDLQYGDWLRGTRRGEEDEYRGEGMEEGWEEDSRGSDNQNSRAAEPAPNGRWESPESRSVSEDVEMAEEDSTTNEKEETGEESVGVTSGDEKIKDSTSKAGVNEITKGENGDLAHSQAADQQSKKNDKGKMKWVRLEGRSGDGFGPNGSCGNEKGFNGSVKKG